GVDCATEELCVAEVSCCWNGTSTCSYVATAPFDAGDITGLLAHIGGLFDSAKLLILVFVGMPLAFVVITRIMNLVPKK
ncbi:unnamed protein product, partial [marine sediment metagenome]